MVARVRWGTAPAPDRSWAPTAGRTLALRAQYVVLPAALLAVWQVCAQIGFIRRNVLPASTDVALVWYDLVTGATDAAARYSGTWLDHAAASIWRVFAGFAWGSRLEYSPGS
jgi:ABC-type nitrate/sulfonate/bicarbonate transport system permease component